MYLPRCLIHNVGIGGSTLKMNPNFDHFGEVCLQGKRLHILEPILRLLNLHLQRQRCRRLERFSK
jgi:hypothetical protein